MSATDEPTEAAAAQAFVDTCILLHFVQQEWERSRTVELVGNSDVDLVASEKVSQEFSAAVDRRLDLYRDMIDYLAADDGAIEEFESDDASGNDLSHLRTIQQELTTEDDPQQVLTRLRTYLRAVNRRVDHIDGLLEESVVEPLPPFELKLAIDRVLNHTDDTQVVSDAAAWTAHGGSGLFVTLDKDDLFDNADRIVETILETQGPEWVVDIVSPDDVTS
jgi:hypothetical protein